MKKSKSKGKNSYESAKSMNKTKGVRVAPGKGKRNG